MSLLDAIADIQSKAILLAGMIEAPNTPKEAIIGLPACYSYLKDGNTPFASYGWCNFHHTIVCDLHVARGLLPISIEEAMPYVESFTQRILMDPTLSSTVQTVKEVRYEFGALEWAGEIFSGVKFEIDIKTTLLFLEPPLETLTVTGTVTASVSEVATYLENVDAEATATISVTDAIEYTEDVDISGTATMTVSDLAIYLENLDADAAVTVTVIDTFVPVPSFDSPWVGRGDDKLYLQSGQFSGTVKTSLSVGAVDNGPVGITWDGTNTPWCGEQAQKLYLQSGQFNGTLKTSLGVSKYAEGISWDGADTPWIEFSTDNMYLTSGQFSATIKTSQDVSGVSGLPFDISYDGTNTPWMANNKLYLQSGQFSATIKTSESVSAIDASSEGISWDGENTPWCGRSDDKLYLQSGQFSSTLKTSEYVGGIDGFPGGICTNNVDGRLGV